MDTRYKTGGVAKSVAPDEFEQRTGQEFSEDGRYLKYVISSGSVDRDGDILHPDGWDWKTWVRNPVVLFAHDHKMPIARGAAIWEDGGKIFSIAEYPEKSVNPLADMMYELASGGFPPNSASVGFRPTKYERRETDDEDDYWVSYDFYENELIEWSQVSAGSNRDATVVASVMADDFKAAEKTGIDISPMIEYLELQSETKPSVGVADGFITKDMAKDVLAELNPHRGPMVPHGGSKTPRSSTVIDMARRGDHRGDRKTRMTHGALMRFLTEVVR